MVSRISFWIAATPFPQCSLILLARHPVPIQLGLLTKKNTSMRVCVCVAGGGGSDPLGVGMHCGMWLKR